MSEFQRLARNPLGGEARDDLRPGLRSVSHGSCVIYFRARPDCLEIVRVLHGARDIRELL